MKGLFLKDMYTLKRYVLWYAVYCAAFVLMAVLMKNTAFVTGLALLLPLSAASATILCDRRDNWTEYALACGLSPLAVAAEKFLLALCFAAPPVILWFPAYFLTFPAEVDLASFSVTLAVAFLAAALTIPLSYKLDVERGRLVLGIIALVLLILCVALMTAFGNYLPSHPALLVIPPLFCAAACVPAMFITRNIIRSV